MDGVNSEQHGHLTAYIMVGPGSGEGMGLPTHTLYLVEGPDPIGTSAATGLHGQGSTGGREADLDFDHG